MWDSYKNRFESYLKLERSLSGNSVLAYLNDVQKLIDFLKTKSQEIYPNDITISLLKEFITWINDLGIHPRSQARLISSLKAFFKYLLFEESISENPAVHLESPKLGRHIPEILSVEEIDKLIDAIDVSVQNGHRNRAIIETLYSCGLRVSELIHLKLSQLFFDLGFIKILGKGNKERLVPIGGKAQKAINLYCKYDRKKLKIQKGHEDYVFLNRRGKQLTRVMIFTIIKELAQKINLQKNISPHTFRHSFASHLIDRGADLRAVQEMLGHSSIMTTEIYTHLDNNYLRSAILEFHPRS